MPRIVDSDAIRLQIIRAFQRLSDTRPLPAISLREIAAEAGMSHTKVLRYFENKNELYVSCVRYASDCIMEAVSAWIDSHSRSQFDSDRSFLDAFLRAILLQKDHGVKPRDVVMTCALGSYSPEVHAVIQDEFRLLREGLAEKLEVQLGRPLSPLEAYTMLILFSGVYFAGFTEVVPDDFCSPLQGAALLLEKKEK